MKIHIQGGTLIDPVAGTERQADVFVADGKIAALAQAGTAPAGFNAEKTIDASGLIVAPGLVDLCARLREPGYEHKATLASEMAAAVAGGVTTLVCPPDTDPVLDEPGLVEMLKFHARNLHQANVHLRRVTGARVHLARLSSAAGLALVREAKAEGLPVTCDVGVNHLHLIDIDIGYFDSQFRLDPPLRGERDREAIRAALADGT